MGQIVLWGSSDEVNEATPIDISGGSGPFNNPLPSTPVAHSLSTALQAYGNHDNSRAVMQFKKLIAINRAIKN